jgi:hypothetical protein
LRAPSLASFSDELTKLGETTKAEEPEKTFAQRHGGKILGAKLVAANVAFRHGAKLPPVQWLGKEIAGVGLRAGMSGKRMINRPTREAFALLVDPQTVAAYEASHAVGKKMQGAKPRHVKKMLRGAGEMADKHGVPYVKGVTDVMEQIPLKPTGARQMVDRVLQPKTGVGDRASTVAKKISDVAKKLVRR